MPFRLTPRICLDLALHPEWSLRSLLAGAPDFANLKEIGGNPLEASSLADIQRNVFSNVVTWDDLKQLRDKWKGKLVINGLMYPGDSKEAVEIGCDAVQVSNHGGRQADFAPSAAAAIFPNASAIGSDAKVFVDGGIRRGADVVRAKALGADFAFAGRPFAYGASASGPAGIRKAFDILQLELSRTLGQMGCPDFSKVDATVLTRRRVI